MRYTKLPLEELLRHMNQKLTDLSGGMEWQVVQVSDSSMPRHTSSFEATRIDDHIQNTHGLAFRTSGKVLDPKSAYDKVFHYFKREPIPGFMESLRKAGHVTIPASWVQQYHLHKAKDGAWAESFVPADHQARFLREDDDRGEQCNHR